jgi:L-alanine-DL-glutamate epimerase-like enolase superfamily enzyme
MKITAITTHVINMPLKLDGDVPHVGGQARTALEMLLVRVDPMRVSPAGVPHVAARSNTFRISLTPPSLVTLGCWIERFYCDFDETPLGNAVNPQRGRMAVPQGPGLGFDLDPRVLRKLAVDA